MASVVATPAAGREKHAAKANNKNISPKSELELQSLFEESSKLFSEGKITTKNAYDVRILDYLKPILELKLGNQELNYHAASQVIDMAARTWAMRVQVLYSSALNSQSLLSRAMKANDAKAAARNANLHDKAKRRALTLKKTVLIDDSKVTVRASDPQKLADADPLFVRIARLFETRGCEGRLLHHMEFNSEGSLLLPGHPRAPLAAAPQGPLGGAGPRALPLPFGADAPPALQAVAPRSPSANFAPSFAPVVADATAPAVPLPPGDAAEDAAMDWKPSLPDAAAGADAQYDDGGVDFDFNSGDAAATPPAARRTPPPDVYVPAPDAAPADPLADGLLGLEVGHDGWDDPDAVDTADTAASPAPSGTRAPSPSPHPPPGTAGDVAVVHAFAQHLMPDHWAPAAFLREPSDSDDTSSSDSSSDSSSGSDVAPTAAARARKATATTQQTRAARCARRGAFGDGALTDACAALSAAMRGAAERKRARDGATGTAPNDIIALARACADPAARTLRRYKVLTALLDDRGSDICGAAQLDAVASLAGHSAPPVHVQYSVVAAAMAQRRADRLSGPLDLVAPGGAAGAHVGGTLGEALGGHRSDADGSDTSRDGAPCAARDRESARRSSRLRGGDDAPMLALDEGAAVELDFNDTQADGAADFDPWDREETAAIPLLDLPAELAHGENGEATAGGPRVARRAPAMANVDEYRVNYCRKVKNVDVGRLKARIWGFLTRTHGTGRRVDRVPADVPRRVESESGRKYITTLEDVMNDIVATWTGVIAASVSDVSPSMCMLCVLHLANEHDLAVWTDAQQNVYIGVDGD